MIELMLVFVLFIGYPGALGLIMWYQSKHSSVGAVFDRIDAYRPFNELKW